MSGGRSYACRAEADLLYDAVVALELYTFADLEGAVEEDGEATEQIGHRVTGSKGNSQAGQAKASEERRQLDLQRIGNIDNPHDNDEKLHRIAQKRNDHVVERRLGLLDVFGKRMGNEVCESPGRPDNAADHDHFSRDGEDRKGYTRDRQQSEQTKKRKGAERQPHGPHRELYRVFRRGVNVAMYEVTHDGAKSSAAGVIDQNGEEDDDNEAQSLPEFDTDNAVFGSGRHAAANAHTRGNVTSCQIGCLKTLLDPIVEFADPIDRLLRELPDTQLSLLKNYGQWWFAGCVDHLLKVLSFQVGPLVFGKHLVFGNTSEIPFFEFLLRWRPSQVILTAPIPGENADENVAQRHRNILMRGFRPRPQLKRLIGVFPRLEIVRVVFC